MEKSNEDDVVFQFEELPLELQEFILIRCDDKTLSTAMPLVSKIINNLVCGEGTVWRAKCRDYYTDSDWEILDELKKLDETWRQFYLRSKIQLFPIEGVDFRTKYDNLKDRSGVEKLTEYGMDYNKVHFSFFNGCDLSSMSMRKAENDAKLPKHWIEYGISWNMTIDECKKLFEGWNATCLIQKTTFSTELLVVKKEYDQFYQVTFQYPITTVKTDPGPISISIRRQMFSRGAFNRTVKTTDK